MPAAASAHVVRGLTALTARYTRRAGDPLGWRALPAGAQWYVAIVIAAGAWVLATAFPGMPDRPGLFIALLAFSCITSAWKVNLPLPLSSGSTLSVSYAADLMALLLLGTGPAMLIAITGGWMQCTLRVKRAYPWYRTVFSMAGEAITIYATGAVYVWLSGGVPLLHQTGFSRTVVGMITAYFVVNTGLVAGAIAWSTRQNAWRVWHDTFLWSAPSFMVAGAAGATAALIVARDSHWTAVLMLAPVYLAYRTYQVFLGRIEDQRRHAEESERLHAEAVDALLQARRAEQALAAETERLAVTLRSIGDGVITTDLTGAVLLVNQTAERLTGWTQREAAGRPLDAVFQNLCPDTRQRCDNSIATVTRAGAPGLSRSTVLVARDLAERPIEEIAAPLRDASGRVIGMVVAFRDITDALKAQAEQASANKLASLGLLAGGIAHDFNNILMAVMGSVSMARATLPGGASARALDEAEQACVRARQITWQLLTFSRGGVPVKKPVSIARLLDDSATLTLRGTNVRCTFDIAPQLWPIAADSGQLAQVISNIVLNAHQAMPHGGTVTIRAENVVETTARWEHALRVTPGRYIRIAITDTGIGIADEHIGRIFDPYFTTKHQGSGLGLATAHSIVKNHGGYLSVTSRPGLGSTVFIGLPAMPAASDAPRERIRTAASARGRILVMEDEHTVGDIAGNMLNFLGHDVEVVRDAHTAVAHYKDALASARPFDAVMLDLVVPGGMGGRETLSLLSEADPEVKAIVVSGYTRDAALAGADAGRVRAFIAKPYTLDELDSTLSSVLSCGKWQVH